MSQSYCVPTMPKDNLLRTVEDHKPHHTGSIHSSSSSSSSRTRKSSSGSTSGQVIDEGISSILRNSKHSPEFKGLPPPLHVGEDINPLGYVYYPLGPMTYDIDYEVPKAMRHRELPPLVNRTKGKLWFAEHKT